MPLAIQTQQLQRRFGDQLAVADVSLHVPEHAVYGFLGRNGAGKTTTLKMLLGLLRPDAGSIVIDGQPVAPGRPPARHIGALLEAHGFYAGLTGRENLDLFRRLLGCPVGEIDRVLALVEMREVARRKVGGYSLGMRQRLGIARALLGAPRVLLLDEPGNGLDPEGMADLRAFLRGLPARTGATVLVSSHLLGEIEQTVTHVGIVRSGRLVLEGALDVLKARQGARLTVRADDLERAAALAREARGEVTLGENALDVRFADARDLPARTAALARALCTAGIAIHALTPATPSLDALYAEASIDTAPENAACPA